VTHFASPGVPLDAPVHGAIYLVGQVQMATMGVGISK